MTERDMHSRPTTRGGCLGRHPPPHLRADPQAGEHRPPHARGEGRPAAPAAAAEDRPADQDIVREGDTPSECCLLVEGFACRYNITAGGKRQILSFHISGDIPDLQSLHLSVMDHSLGTLIPCKLAFIQHDDLRNLMRKRPRLGDLFWRDTLIDAAVFRQWMVNVGRRQSPARMAHVLCELLVRLRAVELVEDHAFDLPVTQGELADALGITTCTSTGCSRISGTGPHRPAGQIPEGAGLGGLEGRRASSIRPTCTW